jgi:hypothetical protein
MSSRISRCLARISPGTWYFVLAASEAVWFALVLARMAQANDCIDYVKNVKNFVGVPKGLIEDCMRTGWVQAAATGVVALAGGSAIALGISKALKGAQNGGSVVNPSQTEGGTDGGQRPNVFDPPTEEQQRMWKTQHVIWDPTTLSYRQPKPGEYPPPDNPPENPPPYQKQTPRSQVPPDCLELYDLYTKAESIVLGGDAGIQAASNLYQKALAHMLELFAKLELYLGMESGQMMEQARGLVKSAGSALRGGGAGVNAAARSGLQDIANRAAEEAQAAGEAVSTQSGLVSQLSQAALNARGEASAMAASIDALKSGLSEVSGLEADANTAHSALKDAEHAVPDAEREVEIAGNRLQRVKTNVARAKQWAVVDEEYKAAAAKQGDLQDIVDKAYANAKQVKDAEQKAMVDAKVEAALEEQVQLQSHLDHLEGQQRQLISGEQARVRQQRAHIQQQIDALNAPYQELINRAPRSGSGVYMTKDLPPAELEQYNSLKEQIHALQNQHDAVNLDLQNNPQYEALQKQIDAVKQRQAQRPSSGIRDAIEQEVANQPDSSYSTHYQTLKAQRDQAEQAVENQQTIKAAKMEEAQRLMNQIDPSYDDPRFVDPAEQDLKAKQEVLDTAKQARDAAKAKLDAAQTKLSGAQQRTAATRSQITDKEGQLKLLNDRVNSLVQQESDATKKLEGLQKIADDKRAEANRLGHAALNSVGDSSAGSETGAGTHAGINLSPPGDPLIRRNATDQSYDPFAGAAQKYKPDWAYWVEEKLRSGAEGLGDFMKRNFGVESSADVAQLVLKAREDVDNKLADLNAKTQAVNDAREDMKKLKHMLDACIQKHTFYTGDPPAQ